jgi:hypothetical protein
MLPFLIQRKEDKMNKSNTKTIYVLVHHPYQDHDKEWDVGMSHEEMLKLSLKMVLEYIALTEDGLGHNARSRYLACQLQKINQYIEPTI